MLSVILPTYQEKDNILNVINALEKVLGGMGLAGFEIIVVDDDSPDGTAGLVKREKPDVGLLVRKDKRGLASAVIDGIAISQGGVVCVLDADMSHPPELIEKLYDKLLKGNDLVVASRLVGGGGVEQWPFHRKLLSMVGRVLVMPITQVRDTMSGFFMFKKCILDGVEITPRGYKILLDILVKAKYKSVIEVPYIFRNREYGQSKINPKIILEYLRQIAGIYRTKIFE